MSFEAAAWAIARRTRTNTAKLVLIALADCHNRDTGQCDPGNTYLADVAQCTKRTVINSIEELVKLGLVTPQKASGRRTTYRLNLHVTGETSFTGEKNAPVKSETATGEICAQTGEIDNTPFSIEPVEPGEPVNNRKCVANDRKTLPPWAPDLMSNFWQTYPRKIDKKKSLEILSKLILKNPDQNFWLAVIEHVRRRWPKGTDKQFIPYPTTFLNGERWEDDIEQSQQGVSHANHQPGTSQLQQYHDQINAAAASAATRAAAAGPVEAHDPAVRPQVVYAAPAHGRG